MSEKIHRREDADPEAGEEKYGDVEFADEVNKKYPIDTPEHVRAAWSYIHQEKNADKYMPAEVEQIERKIRRAAKKLGVELSDHGEPGN